MFPHACVFHHWNKNQCSTPFIINVCACVHTHAHALIHSLSFQGQVAWQAFLPKSSSLPNKVQSVIYIYLSLSPPLSLSLSLKRPHTHTHTDKQTHTQTSMCTHTHTDKQTHRQTNTHTQTSTHTHTHTHTLTHSTLTLALVILEWIHLKHVEMGACYRVWQTVISTWWECNHQPQSIMCNNNSSDQTVFTVTLPALGHRAVTCRHSLLGSKIMWNLVLSVTTVQSYRMDQQVL